jgi:hypothetical protein
MAGLQAQRRSMGLTWVMVIYRVVGGDLSRPWHGAGSRWLRW